MPALKGEAESSRKEAENIAIAGGLQLHSSRNIGRGLQAQLYVPLRKCCETEQLHSWWRSVAYGAYTERDELYCT
jgi:hypothetical protein